jgi:hypothetical protein
VLLGLVHHATFEHVALTFTWVHISYVLIGKFGIHVHIGAN